jgi:hypothetical protein
MKCIYRYRRKDLEKNGCIHWGCRDEPTFIERRFLILFWALYGDFLSFFGTLNLNGGSFFMSEMVRQLVSNV